MYLEPKSTTMRVSPREKELLLFLRQYEQRGWIGDTDETVALSNMVTEVKSYMDDFIENYLVDVARVYGRAGR